ncbi:hypothetical protein Pint_31416 [Pistacia integerrima]|uniref:Uncharacterized protein n=1 Tax=Pistacia integerrima TaxID=434235 RepID=A0ACC0XR60_9ROSI|nr:hypothetical protein Pint_31416 [Pistacia integerrima]
MAPPQPRHQPQPEGFYVQGLPPSQMVPPPPQPPPSSFGQAPPAAGPPAPPLESVCDKWIKRWMCCVNTVDCFNDMWNRWADYCANYEMP